MKKSYIKRLLTRPRAKFTPKLPIIPEEGSDKNFLIEQLEATERLIDEMLYDYWKTPFIYPTYTSFLDYFLQLSDEYTTEILNNRYIFQKNALILPIQNSQRPSSLCLFLLCSLLALSPFCWALHYTRKLCRCHCTTRPFSLSSCSTARRSCLFC